MSNKNNLQKKLNLNYTWLASQVYKEGPYDIPILHCKDDYIPDFIALYSETGILLFASIKMMMYLMVLMDYVMLFIMIIKLD